jgi:hypothetical protein
MGERKVLNKYYPPDFDPNLIPKAHKVKDGQYKIRFMLPCSVKCQTCGEYIYQGKKFNAKKETVRGEDYLGIKLFRFYFRCNRCSSEITIRTDPEHSDYIAEFGCTRNYEPWKEKEALDKAERESRAAEEDGDAMRALENRTRDNANEIDILDALDELRSINARAESSGGVSTLLDGFLESARDQGLTADSALAHEAKALMAKPELHRIDDAEFAASTKVTSFFGNDSLPPVPPEPSATTSNIAPMIIIKKKKAKKAVSPNPLASSANPMGRLAAYATSLEDNDDPAADLG